MYLVYMYIYDMIEFVDIMMKFRKLGNSPNPPPPPYRGIGPTQA
jgi:hypothetical protein